jgi:predicted RNA-binding Zn ribbon-like protein
MDDQTAAGATAAFPTSPGSRAASLGLIGGALALNFANTSSGRGSEQHLEHLRAPADLLAWAHHAGVLRDEDLAQARLLLADGPAASGLLQAALTLREVVHRIFLALAEGRVPAPADLQAVTLTHAATLARARLLPRQDGTFAWAWRPADGLAEALLGPVALSALSLLQGLDPLRVKQCGGQHCGWLFFDTTKNRRRRWCEMSVCGNRAKQRALRQRRGRAHRHA